MPRIYTLSVWYNTLWVSPLYCTHDEWNFYSSKLLNPHAHKSSMCWHHTKAHHKQPDRFLFTDGDDTLAKCYKLGEKLKWIAHGVSAAYSAAAAFFYMLFTNTGITALISPCRRRCYRFKWNFLATALWWVKTGCVLPATTTIWPWHIRFNSNASTSQLDNKMFIPPNTCMYVTLPRTPHAISKQYKELNGYILI